MEIRIQGCLGGQRSEEEVRGKVRGGCQSSEEDLGGLRMTEEVLGGVLSGVVRRSKEEKE